MRTIRPIAISDISETFRVRTATDENRLTSAQLTALGDHREQRDRKTAWQLQGLVVRGAGPGGWFRHRRQILGRDVGHCGSSRSYWPWDWRSITGESGSLAFQRRLLGVVADDRPRHTIARLFILQEARLARLGRLRTDIDI